MKGSHLTLRMTRPNRLKEGQIDALIHVARTVNSHLELEDVLRSIMTVATEVLESEAASLVLVDEETGELVFHIATGEKAESLSAFRLKPGTGIVGHVIESHQSIIVNDAQNDPRFYSKVDDGTGFVTRSILCVPMLRGESVKGAIEVLNRIGNRPYTEADRSLCEAIADQAAIALENAMLHRRLLARERLAAMGETMAGLAHCVRNVLSGIEGGTHLVELGLSESDATTIRQGWEIVRRKNAIVQDLALSMLNYSKERKPERDAVDINQLISGVVELMSTQLTEKHIRLVWSPAPDMPLLYLEPKGIRRCLFNLVGNAIDACGSNHGCAVKLRVEPPVTDTFAIEVADTGCGIEPHHLERLFEPFFSTKGSAGTGLGLAVSHKIVTEHGGRLSVESTPGEGSRFRMVLPIVKAPAESLAAPHEAKGCPIPSSAGEAAIALHPTGRPRGETPRYRVRAGTRMLLVDDDPDILVFLKASLACFEGLEIRTAEDGIEGLALARELRPDLIVLDRQLPLKDGLSVLRDLDKDEATRRIPVIVLSGTAEGFPSAPSDRRRPDAYLQKPVYPAVLQRKVAEILETDEPAVDGAGDTRRTRD